VQFGVALRGCHRRELIFDGPFASSLPSIHVKIVWLPAVQNNAGASAVKLRAFWTIWQVEVSAGTHQGTPQVRCLPARRRPRRAPIPVLHRIGKGDASAPPHSSAPTQPPSPSALPAPIGNQDPRSGGNWSD
jgi:hypothetical protein